MEQNIKQLRSKASGLGKQAAALRKKLKHTKDARKRIKLKNMIYKISLSRSQLLLFIRTGKPAGYQLNLPVSSPPVKKAISETIRKKSSFKKPLKSQVIISTKSKTKDSLKQNINKHTTIQQPIPQTGFTQAPAGSLVGAFLTKIMAKSQNIFVKIRKFFSRKPV